MRLVRIHSGLGTLIAGGMAGRRRVLWARLAGAVAAAVALAASMLVAVPAAGAQSHGAEVAAARPVTATTANTGTWGPVNQFPNWPAGQALGVSCTDANDCTAVGTDGNDGAVHDTKTEGIWSPAVANDTYTASFSLSGVSCSDAADCTAAGGDYEGCDLCNAAVYWTETAGSWGKPTDSSAGQPAYFSGVSCTSATDCTAVGQDFDENYGPFYITETGGTWGTPTQIAASGSLTGVSCTDATDCTAVDSDGTYATETGGTWGAGTGLSGVTVSSLNGVSCTDASDCTVVGQDGNNQPVYATETDGTWGPITQITGAGTFSSVSCTSTTDCTAVGYIIDGAPFYVTESAGQPTETRITSTTASPVTGQPISIGVQVAGTSAGTGVPAPSGTVTVTDGTQSCQAALSGSNGVSTGSCSLTEHAAGSYSITAGYPGDANFGSSTSPGVTVTVAKATTTTGLTVSPGSVTYGHEAALKLTATVSPQFTGTPTGTLTITAGTVTLCKVTLSAATGSCSPVSGTSLSTGSHTLTASYSGDGNFDSSTGASTVKITKAGTKTSLTLSAATVLYGAEKMIVMTVKVSPQFSGTPGGQVIITSGSTKLCTVTLSAGTGKCSLPTQTVLSPGKHTVTAVYQGNANFTTSSASKTLTVNKA